VKDFALADAVLFLRTPAAKLQDALCVLREWRFSYRTHIVCLKASGLDDEWVIDHHQLVLIGTRGEMRPQNDRRASSVIPVSLDQTPAERESIYNWVEELVGAASKVELFIETSGRVGWDAWAPNVFTEQVRGKPASDAPPGVSLS
jgi:N6-adenosine-specific RNA methylase IME4